MNVDSSTVQTTRWSAQLEESGLAAVSIDGAVVVDRLYFAVRDPDWATIALRIDDMNLAVGKDEVTVSVAGATDDATIRGSFSLRLTIAGQRLTVESTFTAEADLSVNRVGWCLLHPMDQAGSAVATESPTGPSISTLPIAIAPHSPFTALSAMEITTPSHQLAFTFTGDLFETEDQRNWIDASFKTFSTPLSEPRPRHLSAGTELHQQVELVVEANEQPPDPAATSASPATVQQGQARPSDRASPTQPPPRPGRLGLQAPRDTRPVTAAAMAALKELALDWIAVTLRLDREWLPAWNDARALADGLDLPLDLTLVGTDAALDAWSPPPALPAAEVTRLQAYDPFSHVTTRSLAEAVHRMRVRSGWTTAAIAGGSRANFAELNRLGSDLPMDLLEEIVFAANPQVHAFDDRSIRQTPAALAVAVHQAGRLAAGRRILVAPLTFAPTFRADAADRTAVVELAPDPRNHSDLAGAWLSDCLLVTTRHGVNVTAFDATGRWGVIDDNGITTPAWRAIRDRPR